MKRKLWKKVSVILLTTTIAVSLLTTAEILSGVGAVFAQTAEIVDSGTCGDNLTWTLDSNGTLTISGNGELDKNAFYRNSRIRNIVIENGLTGIGICAFGECSSLKDIEIPDSVTSIGNGAFEYCSSLPDIEIPGSVTSIGEDAFWGCSSLENIRLSGNITSIEPGMFRSCSSLKEIKIPDGVTSIGDNAFNKCINLKSVPVPDSVTSIGYCSFYGCSSLPGIEIPGSVTSIGEDAFWGCSSLISIKLTDGITTIGERAFRECTSLPDIEIPNSVTTIGGGVFEYCSSLTRAKLQDNATRIAGAVFRGCTRLKDIEIPNSVTTIEGSAFDDCSSLKEIKIPDGVTSIGHAAFAGCSSLEEIEIPDSVTTIEEYLFHMCSSLKKIKLSKNITRIGDSTFGVCSNLKEIVIPDGVTSIEDWAFNQCTSLTRVDIPGSVASIGKYTFYGCSSLADVYYSGSEKQWNKIDIGGNNDYLLNAHIHYSGTGTGSTTDLSKATIKLAQTSYTYDGKNKSPSVKVTLDGKLVDRSNYTLEYKNNKYVGKASVTVKGKGSYTGSKTATYTIKSPGKVTVILNACSGEVSPKSIKVDIGKQYGSLPTPMRSDDTCDYTFKGWYTSNLNGTNALGAEAVTASSYVTAKKTHTLYAVWNEWTVSAKINNEKNKEGQKGHTASEQYSDTWFTKENRNSINLKRISALAAASTYGGESSPLNLLKACGFNEKTIEKHFTGTGSSSTKKDNDHCLIYTGSKMIATGSGKTQKLIAVIISGYSGDGYEWRSNFNLGTGKYHKGFKTASDEAVQYLKSKYKDLGKARIWICGHSRGAAVTNLVATALLKETPSRAIYAYGFATPNTMDKSLVTKSYENRIINIVNEGDFVPELPPTKWDYRKNGKIITFTVTENIPDKTENIPDKYEKYRSQKYTGLTKDERKALINAFCAVGKSKAKYAEKTYGNKMTGYFSAKSYAQDGIAMAMNKKKSEMALGVLTMLTDSRRYSTIGNLTTMLVVNSRDVHIDITPAVIAAFSNKKIILNLDPKIKCSHNMETYLAYVDSVSK